MCKSRNTLKILIVSLFWLVCGLSHHSSLFAQLKSDVVETAKSYIGVSEDGGDNQGPEIKRFLSNTGIDFPAAWCAAFVATVFIENNIETPASAWSPAWFPESNTIYKRGSKSNIKPDSADVFGIYFNSRKRIAHVGIIELWPEKSSFTTTIEGNTNVAGSREGDAVHRKRRLKSQIYKISRWIK